MAVLGILLLFAGVVWLETSLRPDGIFATLAQATHVTVATPRKFGVFHLCALGICLSLAVAVLFLAHRVPGERLDDIVFGVGVALLLLEIYKQLYYHTVLGNGYYNFSVLPLQFCSYAMYLFLLIPLLPRGRWKDALYTFCALYQTMGGCIVMVYPVLYGELSLSIHTMLWHTLMIATGILIGRQQGYGRRYLAEMLPATAIFFGTVSIAVVLNVLLTPYTEHSAAPLNLFYMSPYIKTHYIIIGDVWEAFGWFPALLCYMALFVFVGATLVWLVLRIWRVLDGRKR
ncbi:MAG: YwaF family protein [Clostridia bacterium]|nr:YwaF family protein [Clostridia bacterium]